jgi:hypothetical protein
MFEVREETYQTALENQSNVVVPAREERTVRVSTISATEVTPVLLKPPVIFIVDTPIVLVRRFAVVKVFTFSVAALTVFAKSVLAYACAVLSCVVDTALVPK